MKTLSGVDHLGAENDFLAGENLVERQGAVLVRVDELDQVARLRPRMVRVLRVHVQLQLLFRHPTVGVEVDDARKLASPLFLPILLKGVGGESDGEKWE